MKKIVSLLITLSLLAGLFNVTGFASGDENYREAYLNYAKEADENVNHPLNDETSGIILADLNLDGVPELLGFDINESGECVLTNAFSIIDGRVIEDSPWKNESEGSVELKSNFVPGEKNNGFGDTYLVNGTNRLVMYCGLVPDNTEESEKASGFSYQVWYENSRFRYELSSAEYRTYLDGYGWSDEFVANIMFYNEENQEQYTKSEAMQRLLDKYEAMKYGSESSVVPRKVSDWAASDISDAKAKNLVPKEMLGDDLTEEITRAEFAGIAIQLMYKFFGEELNWHGGYIVDIEENPYEWYITGAYQLGITNGTGINEENGGILFSPSLNITREQLASMLTRAAKKYILNRRYDDTEELTFDISGVKPFADDEQISDYAREAVYYLSKQGITKGIDASHFAPQGTATKEQAIIMALRCYNNLFQQDVANN